MKGYKIEKEFMIDEFKCVVVGQSFGHRCGYVGIPKGNALYGKHYGEIDIDVHGGLTYSEGSNPQNYPGEGDFWWIGFDCGHWGDAKDFDLIKELANEKLYNHIYELEKAFPTGGTIRKVEYVEKEIRNVIKQIKNM